MNDNTDDPATTRCDPIRLWLGAYALGTLEPSDEQQVQTHLASCPACRAELAELDSVLPSLASLSRNDAELPALSPDLFSRITSAADTIAVDTDGTSRAATQRAGKRTYRSKRLLLAVAASVVLLGGAGAVATLTLSSSSTHSQTTVASGTNGAIELRVVASDAATGTRLELTAQGLPRNEHCRLVAKAADGTQHDAGTWDAGYEGQAQVTEATDVPRTQLRQLTLYGNDGTRLVTVMI